MTYLLLLLLSSASFAATPSGVPSVTVSAPGANTGQVTISPSDLSKATSPIFSLYGAISSAAFVANDFYPLYRAGQPYATPSNQKTFCFDITAASSGGNNNFQLVSSQSSIAYPSAALGTAPVYQGGATQQYPVTTGATVNVAGIVPGTYVFGNGSAVTYAGVQINAGSAQGYYFHLDCFEQ